MYALVSHSFLKRLGQENRVRSWKSEEEEELASSSSQSKDFQNGGASFLHPGYGIGKKIFLRGEKGGRKEIVSVVMDFFFRGGIPTFYFFLSTECFKDVCIFTAFL